MTGAGLIALSDLPKYERAASWVRDQITSGTLLPGESAPSGAAVARATGYSVLTCRKALRTLIKEGTLVSGASPAARLLRVSGYREESGADAARVLSAALAARRRRARLTQPELAKLVGRSVTTIGHAETGRLWQGRDFWERVDDEPRAGGDLLALHDAYRDAALSTEAEDAMPTAAVQPVTSSTTDDTGPAAEALPVIALAVSAPVKCVAITWENGARTTVYPPAPSCPAPGSAQAPGTEPSRRLRQTALQPESPARSAGVTSVYWPRGFQQHRESSVPGNPSLQVQT